MDWQKQRLPTLPSVVVLVIQKIDFLGIVEEEGQAVDIQLRNY